MKLPSANVELPEYVEPRTCRLFIFGNDNPELLSYAVQQVGVDSLRALRAKETVELKAIPTCFAIQHVEKTSELMLWPAPDKEYEAHFQYCPIMRQI